MVQVHKYVNYAAFAALIGGMQYVFAPTRRIPYYAIGTLISYNVLKPLIDKAITIAESAFNPGLCQNLAVHNIRFASFPARLYFSDYMLGQSISDYMALLGYSENT